MVDLPINYIILGGINMVIRKTITLLKVLFVLFILLILFQFSFILLPYGSLKMQTYLFALRLPIDSVGEGGMQSLYLYIFLCAVPIYLLALYIIKQLINLFKPLSEGHTPFTEESVSIIKHIGFACWIFAIIKMIVEYSGAQILLHTLQSAVPEWNAELSLPATMLIAGVLVLAFAEVFKQGLALQQDNDSIL